jgi:integrase
LSVRKRGERWVARWVIDGRHVSRAFDLKADAESWEADARRRAQMGAHAPVEPSRDPLSAWIERWWEQESPRWAQSTRLHRAVLLDRWIVPYLGSVRLRDLGRARVRDWLTEIGAVGCSAGQQNHAIRVLSAALGVAVRDGVLPANPCSGIRKAPHVVARPRALSPEQIEAIRAHMPTARDALMVSLMAYAGLRPEEVVALRWSDMETGVIVVDRAYSCGELKGTKTGARRAIEIVAPLVEDIDAARPSVYAREELVASSETGGFLYWGNWRNRVWNPAVIAGGLFVETSRVRDGRTVVERKPTAAPYDLRHSFCSLLIHEGRNPLLVAAAMGHSSAQLIWKSYGHVFEAARLAPAVPMVDAILAARSGAESEAT